MPFTHLLRILPFLILLGLPRPVAGIPDLDICEIQGPVLVSPYNGDLVETHGVVIFDRDNSWEKGFYIQDGNCDGDPGTSDALFVYTGEQTDLVSVGDFVELSGFVTEFGGMTEVSAGPEYIAVTGQIPLPLPAPFNPPLDPQAARAYFEDHEGMRIVISEAVVVGPTTTFGNTYVVNAERGLDRILQGMPTGPIVQIGDEGLFKIVPEVGVGAQIGALVGILDVSFDEFEVRLTAPPLVDPVQPPPDAQVDLFDSLSFASLNLHNLFDALDDPGFNDPVLSPSAYQTKLEKLARTIRDVLGEPYFIAVQEAEKGDVLQSLANRPEIESQYGHVLIDGPDTRGIDIGLMYRTDKVEVQAFEARQGCTSLVDGLGPDGNLDMQNPANAQTCDLDGLPGPEGNRLFSRPPLIVRLDICEPDCAAPEVRTPLHVIAVHLKSKSQDGATAYTADRRIAQAAHLVELVTEIRAKNSGAAIVLLGDFNDTPESETLQTITSAGLVNLMGGVPGPQRYTYVYEGVSQLLDYVFISPNLTEPLAILYAEPQPIGADFALRFADDPDTYLRASDHDPVLVRLAWFTETQYFPFMEHSK